MTKVLIIRLSSLGDILQCLPCADLLRQEWPDSEIHWLVKREFSDTIKSAKSLNKVIEFDKQTGLFNFIKTVWNLRNERYTHIYDAHSNVRSHIASFLLRLTHPKAFFLRRSKNRFKRWLLFAWRVKLLPTPFLAAKSFTEPLIQWGVSSNRWPTASVELVISHQVEKLLAGLSNFVLIAPSAAWELKRWPLEHWQKLVSLHPQHSFVIVGGPQDQFCQELADHHPDNTLNLAGKVNWNETFEVINLATVVVSGDTGVLHMADYLQKPTVALIGPTAFGFPSSPTAQVLEVPLSCRPCTKDGRGKCKNKIHKRCLTEITPETVHEQINASLA
ncbi:MAG: glycosyltransferase family 9 protein [Bdellovibrionales bacterium]|nr:glycosyltransferase family 9 protein [Bdellovibrionales bacterium]